MAEAVRVEGSPFGAPLPRMVVSISQFPPIQLALSLEPKDRVFRSICRLGGEEILWATTQTASVAPRSPTVVAQILKRPGHGRQAGQGR
jgi:hypothetical protein